MENKEFYIDGVDVCRCRHYDDRYGYCDACRDDIDGNSYTKCMYEDDCYYKQLKRAEETVEECHKYQAQLEDKLEAKEQECETLASQLDFEVQKKECLEQECERLKEEIKTNGFGCFNIEMSEQLDQLKAENDELKRQCQADKGLITTGGKLNYQLLQEVDKLKAENDELKKTVMLKCPQCGEVYLDPIGAKLYETLTEIKEIAQYDVYTSHTDLCIKLNWVKKKISEVEDE